MFALREPEWAPHLLQRSPSQPSPGGTSTQARMVVVATTRTCASATPLPIPSYLHVTYARENGLSRMIYYVFVDPRLCIFHQVV